MSKKITWTKKSVFQYFCWFILVISIVNICVIGFFIWKNYDFRIADNFDGTVATILTVLGIFIAFSAINTYSVLNARAEENKQELEKVKKEHSEYIVNIGNRIENYYKKIDALEKRMDNYNLNAEIYDVKHSVVVLERVRAIYVLTERIEKIKRSIDGTDSIREREKLEQDLLSLKDYIKQNLVPYYSPMGKIKNETLQDILNDFKTLLNEKLP
jgi:hypothetical protein